MLVNTQSRAVGGNKFLATKVQSQFSPAELDYLRLLATEILQSGEKMITSRMALNLMDQVGGGKKLSMSEAEASIEKFISCRWLKLVEEGCLTVDVRFLGEMKPGWWRLLEGWLSARSAVRWSSGASTAPVTQWWPGTSTASPSRSRRMWRRSVRTARALSIWTGRGQ